MSDRERIRAVKRVDKEKFLYALQVSMWDPMVPWVDIADTMGIKVDTLKKRLQEAVDLLNDGKELPEHWFLRPGEEQTWCKHAKKYPQIRKENCERDKRRRNMLKKKREEMRGKI